MDLLAPGSVGGDGVDAALGAAQDGVFGIEDFDGELSDAGMQAVERNGDAQGAVGVGGDWCGAACGLGFLEGLGGECGGDEQQCRQEENRLRRLVHEGSPLLGHESGVWRIGPRKRPMSSRHWGMSRVGSSFQVVRAALGWQAEARPTKVRAGHYNVMHVEIAQAVSELGDYWTDGFGRSVPQGGRNLRGASAGCSASVRHRASSGTYRIDGDICRSGEAGAGSIERRRARDGGGQLAQANRAGLRTPHGAAQALAGHLR